MTEKKLKTKEAAKEFLMRLIEKSGKIDRATYCNSQSYTHAITDAIASILAEWNFPVNYEYYRIDVYGWTSTLEENKELSKLTQAQKLNVHGWKPAVAVEHENNWTDWTYELIKLAYVRCPLKVIIAYNHTVEIPHERDDGALLEIAEKTLQATAYYGEDDDAYLLIFGTSGKGEGYFLEGYNRYEYKGYLYNKATGKFEEI